MSPEMTPVATFRPTPRQVRYLEVHLALIAEGKTATHASVGAALGVSRQAVTKFLKQSPPAFRAWLAEELCMWARARRGVIEARCAVLAEKGSVEHIDRLAKLAGWYQPTTAVAAAPVSEPGWTVILQA